MLIVNLNQVRTGLPLPLFIKHKHSIIFFRNFLLTGLILMIITASGCGIKTKFSEAELKWLNVYNVGDTLIFNPIKTDSIQQLSLKQNFIIRRIILLKKMENIYPNMDLSGTETVILPIIPMGTK